MIVKPTTPRAFAPRTVAMFHKSFADALRSLTDAELSTGHVRELVARRIISAAEHGETDPTRLRDDAVIHVSSMMRYRGTAAPIQ